MVLSKDWRSKVTRKANKTVPIASLDGEIIIRPMTAGRQSEIEQRFAVDDDGKLVNFLGYSAAIVADSVLAADGSQLWTEAEVLNELDYEQFREVSDAVGAFLNPKKADAEKN